MTSLFVGVAVVLAVLVAAFWLARNRPSAPVPLKPRLETYRNIRLLRSDDEVRDVARRAYERESLIAHAADRRAARFRQLTRLDPGRSA
jgi:hypothetical protein